MSVTPSIVLPAYLAELDKEFIGFLREYQRVGIKNFHTFIKSDKFFAYFVLPTGAGKTWAVKAIMRSFPKVGKRSKKFIFAVPYQSLAEQTFIKKTIKNDDGTTTNIAELPEFGLWYGNKKINTDANNLIMVIDTLIRRVKTGHINLKNIDCIFIDEFHQHNTIWKEGNPENVDWLMSQAKKNNCKIVGLTGTDYDGKGNNLKLPRKEFNNHLIPSKYRDIKTFIDDGFLTKLLYRVVGHFDNSMLKTSSTENGITRESEEEMILKSGINEAEVICTRHTKKSIVVCKDIEHTETLKKEIEEYAQKHNLNIRVDAMHSKARSPLAILKDFANGIINIILSVEMLTTGVDIPSADTLFLARVIGSQSMWRQIIGRVLRLFDGKEFGIVIDMYDTIGYLGGHPLNRPFTEEQKGEMEKAEPKLCPSCDLPLSRVTVDTEVQLEEMVRIVTKECTHCGVESKEKVALPFKECEVCEGHTYVEKTYTHKGYIVCDCGDCGEKMKIEKIITPQLMVVYRDRLEAYETAKVMYMRKVQNSEESTNHLKNIKYFFRWTERKNILSVMEFLTDEYQNNYSKASALKIINRLTQLNKEFKTDKAKRSVLVRLLIMQNKDHLIEPLSIAFEMAEQLDTQLVPSFVELEKMVANKKRSMDSLLKSWFKKFN